jgi:hypothetical protein
VQLDKATVKQRKAVSWLSNRRLDIALRAGYLLAPAKMESRLGHRLHCISDFADRNRFRFCQAGYFDFRCTESCLVSPTVTNVGVIEELI